MKLQYSSNLPEEILIPDNYYKDDPLKVLFPSEWGLANSFWDYVL
jgi:hypothetical protein